MQTHILFADSNQKFYAGPSKSFVQKLLTLILKHAMLCLTEWIVKIGRLIMCESVAVAKFRLSRAAKTTSQ